MAPHQKLVDRGNEHSSKPTSIIHIFGVESDKRVIIVFRVLLLSQIYTDCRITCNHNTTVLILVINYHANALHQHPTIPIFWPSTYQCINPIDQIIGRLSHMLSVLNLVQETSRTSTRLW